MANSMIKQSHILLTTADGVQHDLGNGYISAPSINTGSMQPGDWEVSPSTWKAELTVDTKSMSQVLKKLLRDMDLSSCALPMSLPIIMGDQWFVPRYISNWSVTSEFHGHYEINANMDIAEMGTWKVTDEQLQKLRKIYRSALIAAIAVLSQGKKDDSAKSD